MTIRLNAQLSNAAQREEADITESNALGVVTRTREEFNQQYFGELLLNGTLNWTPTARDTVNLTGRLTPRTFQRNFGSIWRNPAGVLTTLSTDDYTEKDILHAELGGDWEHKFSPQNAVEADPRQPRRHLAAAGAVRTVRCPPARPFSRRRSTASSKPASMWSAASGR